MWGWKLNTDFTTQVAHADSPDQQKAESVFCVCSVLCITTPFIDNIILIHNNQKVSQKM